MLQLWIGSPNMCLLKVPTKISLSPHLIDKWRDHIIRANACGNRMAATERDQHTHSHTICICVQSTNGIMSSVSGVWNAEKIGYFQRCKPRLSPAAHEKRYMDIWAHTHTHRMYRSLKQKAIPKTGNSVKCDHTQAAQMVLASTHLAMNDQFIDNALAGPRKSNAHTFIGTGPNFITIYKWQRGSGPSLTRRALAFAYRFRMECVRFVAVDARFATNAKTRARPVRIGESSISWSRNPLPEAKSPRNAPAPIYN